MPFKDKGRGATCRTQGNDSLRAKKEENGSQASFNCLILKARHFSASSLQPKVVNIP